MITVTGTNENANRHIGKYYASNYTGLLQGNLPESLSGKEKNIIAAPAGDIDILGMTNTTKIQGHRTVQGVTQTKQKAGSDALAAMQIAGVSALLYEKIEKDTNLTPEEMAEQVTSAITQNITPFPPNQIPNDKKSALDCTNKNFSCGDGILNAEAALNSQ